MKTDFCRRALSVILAIAMVFSLASVIACAEDTRTLEGLNYTVKDGKAVITSANSAEVYDEIYIPESIVIGGTDYDVVEIADSAFNGCTRIVYVSFPETLVTIGANAFKGCYSLEKVNFYGELEYIGEKAFNDTRWYQNYPTEYVFASTPHGLNYLIGYKPDADSEPLTELQIPLTVDKIGERVFEGNTDIQSLIIPERCVSIGAYAFKDCTNLSSVTIKSALEYSGRDAFAGTAWLDNYDGEYIVAGSFMFKYAGDEELVYIPNTIKAIASYCFEGCENVVAVRVPMSVTNIGDEAFFLFNDNSNDKYAEIYTWEGSAAETYAKEHGANLVILSMPGDMNLDGLVRADDARYCLRCAAKLDDPKNDESFVAGDINCDSEIKAGDARSILRMAADLEDYTPMDLLYKPNTNFEILMAYAESIRYAIRKNAGYDLKEYQELTEINVGPAWFRSFLCNPFNTSLTKEKKAKTVSFEQDSLEAIEKLYACDLSNSGIIKSAKCVISGDHKYYEIEITLNDETDVVGTDSYTSKILPVLSHEDLEDILTTEEAVWYKACGTDFNFDVVYHGCKIVAKIDISNGGIVTLDTTTGYRFDMSGKVNLISIKRPDDNSEASGATGDSSVGYALRVDTAKYSNFDYIPEEFESMMNPEVETTTAVATTEASGEETTAAASEDSGLDLSGVMDTISGIGDTIGGLVGDVDLGGIADTVGGLVGDIDLGGITDTIGGLLG